MVEVPLPIDLDELPLVARTNLRDVRLVTIDAHAPDIPDENADVHVVVDEMAYRVEGDAMFVRVTAKVRYSRGQNGSQSQASEEDETLRAEVGRIVLTVLAELSLQGGSVSQAQADEFMGGTLLFMVFPYIRTSIQQVSADLRLPLTVLPFLRRNVAGAPGSDDAVASAPHP